MHGSDLRSGQEIRINGVVLRLLPEGLDPVGCRDYDGAWEAFYTERQREEPETYPPDKKPPVIWPAPKGMERFVVVDDGGCLGALEMGTYLDDDANPQPRLAWIWMDPTRRGNGLGKQVLTALLQALPAEGHVVLPSHLGSRASATESCRS